MLDHRGHRDEEKKETTAERKARVGFPSQDIKELLKEIGCEDAIPKLEENKIDQDIFWYVLEEGHLEDQLGIKTFGKKKKLMNKIQSIRKDHLDKKDKEHRDSKKVDIASHWDKQNKFDATIRS